MKKSISLFLLCGLISSSLLIGCGSQAETTSSSEQQTSPADVQEVSEDEKKAEEIRLAEEQKKAEEERLAEEQRKAEEERLAEEQIIAQEPRNAFLTKNNLTITSQGDFKLPAISASGEDIEIKSYVEIAESTEGCEMGYKNLTCHFIMDTQPEDYNFILDVFDRYTGTVLDLYYKPGIEKDGTKVLPEGAIDLAIDDTNYPLSLGSMGQYDEEGRLHVVLLINCPMSYDGPVFVIGYPSPNTNDSSEQTVEPIYTFDESDEYKSNTPYYCFTLSND